MNQITNCASTWDNEYREAHSIPSSDRTMPSKALCIVAPLIDFSEVGQVLDAGCGNGRNAIYLASHGCNVTAVDFSRAAIETTAAKIGQENVTHQIRIEKINLFEPLPYNTGAFGLCVDSYVSCHFTNDNNFRTYWNELSRVTRVGGLIYSSMFCDDDEYYAKFKRAGINRLEATDPTNQITKVLHTEDQFKSLFEYPLAIKYFLKFQFTDVVLGQEYLRSLLVVLLQKNKMSAHAP
jgi:SAM-dependent methyltransferase